MKLGILTRVDPTSDFKVTFNKANYPIPNTKCRDNIANRKDLKETDSEERNDKTGISKNYMVHFSVKNAKGVATNFVLASAHLKAEFLNWPACFVREAQATGFSRAVTQYAKKGEEVIILGDLNDMDNDLPKSHSVESISGTLAILKNNSLTNVASNINIADLYSSWFKNTKALIDHILISPGLARKTREAKIRHDLYGITGDERVSDHWPIEVTFDLTQ